MRTAPILLGLAALGWAAASGSAEAAPFVIRTAGADTAIAVDLGTVRSVGAFRTAWAFEFFRRAGGLLPGRRLQIMAIRKVVDCKTRQEKDMTLASYLANGARLPAVAPDGLWIPMLRGSNSERILGAICEGPDSTWTRVRAATVFDAYRATWR